MDSSYEACNHPGSIFFHPSGNKRIPRKSMEKIRRKGVLIYKKIDITLKNSLKKSIKPYVYHDLKPLYEEAL